MVGQSKEFKGRVFRGESGFTLIEMIVVVGIIAVLAAVIIPNIGKFIGSGEQGAKDAEYESVQFVMNAMMADTAITTVTASASSSARTADFTSLPVGTNAAALGVTYLQSASTVYYYCWDSSGQVQSQGEFGSIGTC